MFENYIEEKKSSIVEELNIKSSSLSVVEILEKNIKDKSFYLYLDSEIKTWLYQEKKRIKSCSNFNFDDPDFHKKIDDLDEYYQKNAILNSDDLDIIITSYVRTRLNFLLRPRTTLRWFVFRNENLRNIDDVILKLNYFNDYAYIVDGLKHWAQEFYKTKGSGHLASISEFSRQIERLDNEKIFDLSPEAFIELLTPIFETLKDSENRIPSTALIVFLDDKGLTPIARSIEKLYREESLDSISKEEFFQFIKMMLEELENSAQEDPIEEIQDPFSFEKNEDIEIPTIDNIEDEVDEVESDFELQINADNLENALQNALKDEFSEIIEFDLSSSDIESIEELSTHTINEDEEIDENHLEFEEEDDFDEDDLLDRLANEIKDISNLQSELPESPPIELAKPEELEEGQEEIHEELQTESEEETSILSGLIDDINDLIDNSDTEKEAEELLNSDIEEFEEQEETQEESIDAEDFQELEELDDLGQADDTPEIEALDSIIEDENDNSEFDDLVEDEDPLVNESEEKEEEISDLNKDLETLISEESSNESVDIEDDFSMQDLEEIESSLENDIENEKESEEIDLLEETSEDSSNDVDNILMELEDTSDSDEGVTTEDNETESWIDDSDISAIISGDENEEIDSEDDKILPQLSELISDKEKDKFIKKLFMKDFTKYNEIITTIEPCKTWREAAEKIDLFFAYRGINPSSSIAEEFRELIQVRYA